MRDSTIGVLVAIFLVSCRTATPQHLPSETTPPVTPQTLVQFRNGGLNVEIRFQTLRDSSSPLHRFVFGIESIQAVFSVRGRATYDTAITLPLVNGTTGLREKLDTISTEGYGRWSNPLGVLLDTVRCRFEIATLDRRNYSVTFDTVMSLPADSTPPFVTVTPFIDAQTDTNIVFALLAKRNRGYGEDYHPTSERLRVQIFDSEGRLRFSSNTGIEYLQEVSPVQPRRGEIKRFTFEWPGTDDNGTILPAGRYTAVLSLVAKPYPYTASISFDWKGGKP